MEWEGDLGSSILIGGIDDPRRTPSVWIVDLTPGPSDAAGGPALRDAVFNRNEILMGDLILVEVLQE